MSYETKMVQLRGGPLNGLRIEWKQFAYYCHRSFDGFTANLFNQRPLPGFHYWNDRGEYLGQHPAMSKREKLELIRRFTEPPPSPR